MIRRTFKKGEKTMTLLAPSQSEWSTRYVQVQFNDEVQTKHFKTNAEARSAANGIVSRYLADGFVECRQRSSASHVVTGVQALSDAAARELAVRIAADLSPSPDWNIVWDRLEEHAQNATIRRKLLAAVQAAFKDKCDEQERLERLRRLAETEEVKAAAERAKEERLRLMAVAMASQPESASGERKIDFSE